MCKDCDQTGYEELCQLTPATRLTDIWDVIQRDKDRTYREVQYRPLPAFAEGEKVLVCSELYYVATILEISLGDCPYNNKQVPCYKVIYDGWRAPQKYRDWVMEYDIVGLRRNFRLVEHLAAHYWNQIVLCENNPPIPNSRRVGVYRLSSSQLDCLEKEWQPLINHKISETEHWTFAHWIGLA